MVELNNNPRRWDQSFRLFLNNGLRYKRTAVCLVVCVMFLLMYACLPAKTARTDVGAELSSAKKGPQTSDTSQTASINHRFKPEHFVLMFTGNWEGHLGPCGCAEQMLGGIDRRSRILNGIARDKRLLLDTGRLIKTNSLQAQLKLETFLLSMQKLGYDAIGLTYDELVMKDALGIAPDTTPPVVASNLTPEATKAYSTIRSFEKTLHWEKHQRRCLVLALSEMGPEEQNPATSESIQAIRATRSAENIDPQKPSDQRLVIVLMASASEEILASLRAIRAVDLVVKSGYTDKPELIRESQSHLTVLTTGHLGKYLAVIELPVDPQAHRDEISFQAIAIEEHFPKDAGIVDLIQDYLDQLEFENLVADEQKLPRRPLDEGNFFVGSKLCMDCHEEAYEKWQSVPHSHALETLVGVKREFDPECVQCHSVGMHYESGFRSLEATPDLAGVGCEMCHGPGANHISNTEKDFKVTFTACAQCHDPENDPHFLEKSDQKFQTIKHWSEKPRSSWHPQD